MLGLNGHRITSSLNVDAAEEYILAIADNELTWEQIAPRLPDFSEPEGSVPEG